MRMQAPHRSTLRSRLGSVAAVAATVAGAGLVGVVTAGSASAAPAGTAPTATHALALANATDLGHAAAGTPLRLTVGLAPQDEAGLKKLIAAQATPGSASYGKFLTPSQFTSRYGATAAAATAVADYLRSAGMTHVAVSSNRLQVTADATVAQAESAFRTHVEQFRQGGTTVLANTADAVVPSSLAGTVTGVVGLSTLGMHTLASSPVPKLTGYYPEEFNTVYDSGSTTDGAGQTMAIIAEGDLTQTVTDLRTAEARQGLPQTPVTIEPTGPAGTDTSGTDEWDLDTQTSTGTASGVDSEILYDATSLTDADLARAINQFAADDTAVAGSASLGECDLLPYLDGSMTIDDMALAEAAAQGQTFFASSGDTGSSCAVLPTNGVPASGLPDTEYPASGTYTNGVGGTTLLTTDADAYTSELGWNAGGGGISAVEYPGAWTDGVQPASAGGLRGVPDVAFDADPTTGANIYVDGTAEEIGGTSLASPLALGLWTRIQSSHGGTLGFAPPKLYGLYAAAQNGSPLPPTVPGFHDVVAGANGTYTATPGYDYVTGLGSWDVAKLSAALG
jgi:subtilase family serine protease